MLITSLPSPHSGDFKVVFILWIIRIKLNRLVVIRYSPVIIPFAVIHITSVVVIIRVIRVKLNRLAEIRDSAVVIPFGCGSLYATFGGIFPGVMYNISHHSS